MSDKHPLERAKRYLKGLRASAGDESGADRERIHRAFLGSCFFMFLGLSNPLESNLLSGLLTITAAIFTRALVKDMMELQLCLGPWNNICSRQEYPILYKLEISAWILITIGLIVYGIWLLISI